MDTLGKRLAGLRKGRGLTQGQLAKRLGLAQSTIASWEVDARSPNPEFIRKLALFFNVSTDYLLGRPTGELTPSQRITALRNMKKLSQVQMARELGFDVEWYRELESGAFHPERADLIKIADYHDVDIRILYGLPPLHLSDELYADGYTEKAVFEDMERQFRTQLGYGTTVDDPQQVNEETAKYRVADPIVEGINAWLRADTSELTDDEKKELSEDMVEYLKMRAQRIASKRNKEKR